jgi:hypothetical protein
MSAEEANTHQPNHGTYPTRRIVSVPHVAVAAIAENGMRIAIASAVASFMSPMLACGRAELAFAGANRHNQRIP